MVLHQVNNCPSTFSKWRNSSKECPNTDYYHCVLDENSNFVQGCIKPIWIETGFCPVYNTRAVKMDSQKCKRKECPAKTFRSFQVYQYPECLSKEIPSVDTTLESENYSSTTQNSTTTESSGSLVPILVPLVVILLLSSVLVFIAVLVLKKRSASQEHKVSIKESKANRFRIRRIPQCSCITHNDQKCNGEQGGNGKRTPERQTKKDENVEQEEKLLCGVSTSKCNVNTEKPDSLTREEWLTYMNINILEKAEETSQVLEFAFVLHEKKSLALIGKWGSGKRTLAVQIALKMENVVDEKFRFQIIHHFDEMSESNISKISQPAVIILPELHKFWCTDQHNKSLINFLVRIRSTKTKLYIIATFTEKEWETFIDYFPFKNPDSIFPERRGINLSSKTLAEIGEKNNFVLMETEINEKMSVTSVLGRPLITILYCKHILYRNSQFLRFPLFFILSDLRRMRDSSNERMKFRVLEYTMLHGGEVDKEKLENDIDHPLFDKIDNVDDKRGHIKGCITQLLNGYIEETLTSYRILHDVITKCVFLVAAQKDPELLFRECDRFLLFDCIRLKSRKEKITDSGNFSIDYDSLSIGIPTESYPMIVNFFKQRKGVMQILPKVNLFETKEFQRIWNKAKTQYKETQF